MSELAEIGSKQGVIAVVVILGIVVILREIFNGIKYFLNKRKNNPNESAIVSHLIEIKETLTKIEIFTAMNYELLKEHLKKK